MWKRSGVISLAMCLVLAFAACNGQEDPDDEEADADEEQADVEESEEDTDDETPYLHEELENAMANLEAPEPGTAEVRFENGDEYLIEELECTIEEHDPEQGQVLGRHEFEDGTPFRILMRRFDMGDSLTNEFTLYVDTPEDDEIDEAMFTRTTGTFPIMAEEGAEGRSAFVLKVDGSWYAGAVLRPQNELSDPHYDDYGESWMAATCE